MQIPLILDKTRLETLTAQLTGHLRDAIRLGRIPAGARLPSSRSLAEQLGISRNTVTRAYEILLADGYVETRPASGVFATPRLPEVPLRAEPLPGAGDDAAPVSTMPAPRAVRAQRLVSDSRSRITFDFFPGRPNPSLFPLKAWRRLAHSCLRQGAVGLSEYASPAGLGPLRSAIAHHLATTRGLVADPAQIIVVNGIQEGISLASRLLVSPGATAVVEDPCYQGAAFAFDAAGATLAGVPVDEGGLVADRLPQGAAALLYLTPSHQYPTGHTLAADRRSGIIAWARQRNCYVLEDDYDCDFRYEGSPQLALAADAPDCVIYLGTFSKSLGAGLRIGYMVVPRQLAEAAEALKALLNNGNAWLEQAMMAEFLRSGSHAQHVARSRSRYRESRDATMAALHRHFGEANVSGEDAGLHLLWYLPQGVPDADILEVLGRRVRVGVYAIGSAGAYVSEPSILSRRSIVLGYAALTPRQIESGIAKLSNAIDDALDAHKIDVDDLVTARAVLTVPSTRARSRHLDPYNRQRAALRSRPRRGAVLRHKIRDSSTPMPLVKSIFHYPVKGLSAQPLSNASLTAGKPFPKDRILALARPGSTFDEETPQWAKKGMFVMLMLEEALATVTTRVDVDSGQMTIMRANDLLLEADLNDADDRAEIEAFIHGLVPGLRAAPRLLRSAEGHFMDKPDNVISLINLATVRSLEQQWGYDVDPLRFRANIYVDGAEPWEEFGWVGSDIRIGDALCRVDRRNGRCSATNVNPGTGRRDLDIPGSLRAAFGHKDLGVYLTVVEGGTIAVGDRAEVDRPEQAAAAAASPVPLSREVPAARRFICRGCYFVYEESAGLPAQSIPPGTAFAGLPATWRCPDCGTDKATFRPHLL